MYDEDDRILKSHPQSIFIGYSDLISFHPNFSKFYCEDVKNGIKTGNVVEEEFQSVFNESWNERETWLGLDKVFESGLLEMTYSARR